MLAGIVQGLTGFGAALIAIPLLCLYIDIKLAVPLTILNSLIINTFLVFKLRHHLDYKKILPLLLGAGPGVVTGLILFGFINSELLKLFLGVGLICYGSYCLLFRPKPIHPAPIWAYLTGFLTGLITTVLSAGGPPAIIYTTMTAWKKEVIKATLIGFFTVTSYLAIGAQALGGFVTGSLLLVFLKTAPAVLLGTILGSAISGRVNRKMYLLLIYLLLIAMGVILVLG